MEECLELAFRKLSGRAALVQMSARALAALPGPRLPSSLNVVVLEGVPEQVRSGGSFSLRFPASSAQLLCAGPTDEALVVFGPQEDVEARAERAGQAALAGSGRGDGAFLASLPEVEGEVTRAAKALLAEVRKGVAGELARNRGGQVWVNEPGKEWTIRYEPWKRDLLVRIYGPPHKHAGVAAGNSLLTAAALKQDRPSYTRFYVRTADEVADAARLIEDAARLRKGC